jgi:anti-sigma regulatory factor (Ser/Thr protein kinase)
MVGVILSMGRPMPDPEGGAMEVSVPASPSRRAGVRQAVRADLGGVSDEVADDVVLALSEAATNAILYGSGGAADPGGRPRQR